MFIPKEKRVLSAKWDPRSERCILVRYDGSGIYCLWNGHRVIRSKDVIFDETPICLVTPPGITPPANISSKRSITPLPICNTSLRRSAEIMHFPVTLVSLNETLENDGGEGLDDSHAPPYISRENTASSSLSSLGSTPDPVPGTPVLQKPRYQTRSKVPLGSQHTAWLIIAYLAGYNAGVPDLLSYSEALNGPNAAHWKLGCDDEFQSLDENNTWKLVPRPRTQVVLGGKWVFQNKARCSRTNR